MSIFLFILGMLAVFMVFTWFSTRGDALTGRATVVSHRMGGAQTYLVTFHFSDGDELELYVSEEAYKTLAEGTFGTLVWHNNVLSRFEAEEARL